MTEMMEHQLEEDICDEILEHFESCENCLSLYNTLIKTAELFQEMEHLQLPVEKKKVFHRWVHIEAKKFIIRKRRR